MNDSTDSVLILAVIAAVTTPAIIAVTRHLLGRPTRKKRDDLMGLADSIGYASDTKPTTSPRMRYVQAGAGKKQ